MHRDGSGQHRYAGLKGVAGLLAGHLLPGAARHDGPARHVSLQACYGCSHVLLPAQEQCLCLRLACFADCFSLEAGVALAAELAMTTHQATMGLMALVAKSLVMADFRTAETEYRLLCTAHAYARAPQVAAVAAQPGTAAWALR